MRFIPAAKAEGALSLLPALIMHRTSAARTPFLEKLDVKTCPLGANGAIRPLWREMLKALIARQNEPLVIPSQVNEEDRLVGILEGAEHNYQKNLLRCRWNHDGTMVGAGSSDQNLYIWSAATQGGLLWGVGVCILLHFFAQEVGGRCHDGGILFFAGNRPRRIVDSVMPGLQKVPIRGPGKT